MFVLIAPVNRLNFGGGFNDWRKMLREAAINYSILNRAQRYSQEGGIKSEDFEELVVEQEGDTLKLYVFGSKYFVCVGPNDRDSLEHLNSDFRKLKLMIQNGDIDVKRVVCDFSRVKYMSSEALGVLVSLHNVLKKQGGELKLTGLSDQLRKVMDITRLDRILKVV